MKPALLEEDKETDEEMRCHSVDLAWLVCMFNECLTLVENYTTIFTARCTLVQTAKPVLRLHVVCPSVCLSVCLPVTLVDQYYIARRA